MSQDRKKEGLTALGGKTTYANEYNPSLLEAFENLNQENGNLLMAKIPFPMQMNMIFYQIVARR